MKEILNKIIGSFDNNPATGFSAKKLTAFITMVCVVAAHIKWITLGDFSQLEMVLTIDFAFVLSLYGINEWGKKQNQP